MNPPPIPDPHFNPDAPRLAPQNPTQGDGTGGIIPFKNPNALAAYYVGLFSLLPLLSYVMAPLAVFLGIKGLKYAKSHPIVKGQVHAWIGILCGAFWSLIHYGLTVVGLIAWASSGR